MMSMVKDDDQAKIYMCQGPPGTGKFLLKSYSYSKNKHST